MHGYCKHCNAVIAACYTECSNCNPERVNHLAAARKEEGEAIMHHITYRDYTGREQVVKLPAAEIDRVLFLIGSLRRAKMEYQHVFWD